MPRPYDSNGFDESAYLGERSVILPKHPLICR